MDLGFESGFSDFDVDVEEVEVKKVKKYDRIWHIRGGGSIYQKPAVHEGVMYFGAMDSYVYAVNAETGEEIWRTKLDGPVMGSCPVIKGNAVYIDSYGYDFYALDRETGRIIWRFRTNGEIMSTPAVWNDKIYFCSGDGYAYCLDLEGKPVWKFKTGDKVASSPAVAEGKMVFGGFDENYYCLDAETGEEIWRFRTGAEIWHCNPLEIREGRVYISSFDNFIYCLDFETGKEIWRFRTGKYGNSSAPVYYDGFLYHGTRDGTLYALTLEGKELWRFASSNLGESEIPPTYGAWKMEIKKSGIVEENAEEERYKEKKEETVSLSDYHVTSEYSTTSEYKQKSDYDTSFVIFEGALEENIGLPGLKFEPMIKGF